MDVVSMGLAAALVIKLLDFLKMLFGKDYGGAIRTAGAWLVGFVVATLFHFSGIAKAVMVYGHSFGSLDFGSLLIVGLLLGSGGAFAYDIKRAVDSSDSAKTTPAAVE